LDDSKIEGARFKGLEIELHRFSGARVLRVVHPGVQEISEHRHDWTYIGIHTAGRYIEHYDGGEADMCGPSAVLHPAGRPHADQVHAEGLETLTIEFDPAWFRLHGFTARLDCSRAWSGGPIGTASRRLAALLQSPATDEARAASATAAFMTSAFAAHEVVEAPGWVSRVRGWALTERNVSAADIARRIDLHPAYLAQTYRYATGEGLTETLRRRRVETACSLLRDTRLPLADIAIAAGFCDQSHMNRCFRVVLGRTPKAVRDELHPCAPLACLA
jgi:AraC family transcriptional regulator